MDAGKKDALRQEQGLFCILFVAAWTKRMASGGTRPAGFDFNNQNINTAGLAGFCLTFQIKWTPKLPTPL
jgi:hypothetical protein